MDFKYPLALRLLHWLMAGLVITAIALGFGVDFVDKSLRGTFMGWHKSCGLAVLLLLPLRIWIRSRAVLPPLPVNFLSWERKAATAGHHLLYLGMAVMAASGVIMSMSAGYNVPFFGWFSVPPLWDVNKTLGGQAHTAHITLIWGMVAVLAIHILAVIKHFVIDRTNLLNRII